MRIEILIADDHPFTLMGTTAFVKSLGYQVEDICSNGITAFNLIMSHQPVIAILDINMPGLDGIEVLEKISQQKLKTKVVLLTMHKEMTIFKKAERLGVCGYLLKEHAEEELEICLNAVIKNRIYVSKRMIESLVIDGDANESQDDFSKLSFAEKKIVALVAQQKTSKQIGELLFISEKTVEGHRSSIIQKLGLSKGKGNLVVWATKHLGKG
jgi:DNA-binding NarL/FixJ family response regulator